MGKQTFLRVATWTFVSIGVFVIIGGLLLTHFTTFDDMEFAFSISFFSLASGLAMVTLDRTENNGQHQNIGGFFPTKDLDSVIHGYYVRRYNETGNKKAHGLKKPAKYTNREKDAERLISLLPEHDGFCIRNIARCSYTCKYKYRGEVFEATSASREMAICIAFLRSCKYEEVKPDLN